MALAPGNDPHVARQPSLETQRTADVLVDILVQSGVEVVFGIPGGAIATLNDALLDRPEIKVVTTRHECGAVFAAAGYAHATGKLAVVLVTSGPGALNTLTGVASAFCDSIPVLVLAGEVPRALFGKGALQEGSSSHLNIVGMAKQITKLALELTDPNSAPAALKRAIATAKSGRPGPVLVTMPLDITGAGIRAPHISSEVRVDFRADDDTVRKVAGTLSGAKRPVIFAGSGARWGRGPAELMALAERLQVPVMTTPKGKGVFPESHPLSLGVFGHGGHPSATKYLEGGIDVLLAVGTGLTDPATNGWSSLLSPSEHFIQIDADALRMGRNYPVSIGLIGPAEALLHQIAREVPGDSSAKRQFGITMYTDPRTLEHGEEGRIAPQRALWEIQQVMPRETLFTSDIGEHLLFATHYLRIDDPRGFLIMTGLASMGSSIAGALGMKLGRRDRPVVAVCGDGCFAMALGDLATACQERVPLVIAVLNDGRYGMVELGHLALYGRTPPYPCTELRIEDLARGLGAKPIVVEKSGDILKLDRSMLLSKMPVVLDIRFDRTVRMPKDRRTEQLGKSLLSRPGRTITTGVRR